MKKKLWIAIPALLIVALLVGKTLLKPSCSSCSTASAAALPIPDNGTPAQSTFVSLENAIKVTTGTDKLLLVDVYTDWCHWCKKMEKEVYTDPQVQKTLQQYFAVSKVNAESPSSHIINGKTLSEQQLAELWKANGFPTVVILDKNLTVIKTISGYIQPEAYTKLLTYYGSGAYHKTSFEEWSKL